jgi:hypothetical protein
MVQRAGASTYLRLTLVTFAGSIIVTRLFLAITGYPRIATGAFHIAHVLWGGLLLFVASIVPLIIANRWALTVAAVCSGIGMGLFIDEVGKFITQNNDYFFPAAAPIIYAVFLLTVLLYLRVRRTRQLDPRAELYQALDALGELLDHDLQPEERAELEGRLTHVEAEAPDADSRELATALLGVLGSDALTLAPARQSAWRRWSQHLDSRGARWLNARNLRLAITAGLGVLSAVEFGDLTAIVGLALAPPEVRRTEVWAFAAQYAGVEITTTRGLVLVFTRVILSIVASSLLAVGMILLIRGRMRSGLLLAYFGLLFSLTVVNLLVFYFDQFLASAGALVEFILLQAVIWYRTRYLGESA